MKYLLFLLLLTSCNRKSVTFCDYIITDSGALILLPCKPQITIVPDSTTRFTAGPGLVIVESGDTITITVSPGDTIGL